MHPAAVAAVVVVVVVAAAVVVVVVVVAAAITAAFNYGIYFLIPIFVAKCIFLLSPS